MRCSALFTLSLCFGGMMVAVGDVSSAQEIINTAATDLVLGAADNARPVTPRTTSPSRDAILEMAQSGYERIRDIRDYSCLLVKRERVDGVLGEYQYMQAKVRHARRVNGREIPFSVYLKFLEPADLQGREVLYVEGQNDGKIIAKKGGTRFAYVTTEVNPTSDIAMRDNRYPITEFGFENLVKRFLERLDSQLLENCTIQTLEGSKVDGRPCRSIQVVQNERTPDADFYLARVYIDEELQIPIHYEAYDWPSSARGKPRLLEQYTYRQVKLNVGFSDADFQRDNPAYGFGN